VGGHLHAAPRLFRDELNRIKRRLKTNPRAGSLYEEIPGIRRMLLSRSAHHVYDSIDEEKKLVEVRAVWHRARGAGPSV
jgi:plasmid stabilization system protein ParE